MPATNNDQNADEDERKTTARVQTPRARGVSRRDDETCDPRAAVAIHPLSSPFPASTSNDVARTHGSSGPLNATDVHDGSGFHSAAIFPGSDFGTR